jgi:hypothetical protein
MELARILPDKALPVHRSEEDFLTAVVTQLVKDFQWDLERVKKANMPMNSLVEGEIEWGNGSRPERHICCLLSPGFRGGFGAHNFA